MEFKKPIIVEKDLKLQESFNRQFLSNFKDRINYIPKVAWETCDSHLTLKQPFFFVDIKGNPVKEIFWEEPFDVLDFWNDKMRILWFGIFVASLFFFLILYYFWGKTI